MPYGQKNHATIPHMEDRPLVIGKGTYKEVRPGVYQYRHSLGKDPRTGKYRYSPKRTIYTKKKSEVTAALEAYKQELNAGILDRKHMTVAEYADQFHELRDGTMNSPLAYTRESYDIANLKELFGDYDLSDLKSPIIKNAYAKARKSKRFSDNAIHKINKKLSQIMDEAVTDELIAKNPCATISVPEPKPEERQFLEPEEAVRFLECLLAEDENGVAISDARIIGTLLLLGTGMRRSEMLGLTWQHFHPEVGTIYIAQQFAADQQLRAPKSKASKRHLYLSDDLMQILQDWHQTQATYFARIAVEQVGASPIVNNELGGFLDPNGYARWFRSFCVNNGFGEYEKVRNTTTQNGKKHITGTGYKGLTPHMLRHTHASLLIGSNVDLKTVQSRLGHANFNLTLNTYAHLIDANDKAAAETFSGLLKRTIEHYND